MPVYTDILSPRQLEVFRAADARINVLDGAVRSGKSVVVDFLWLDYCINGPRGHLIMCGKTVHALRRNVIDPLIELVGSELEYYSGEGVIRLWDRLIHVVGANDLRAEHKIRGLTVAGALGDEVTIWPESFFQMLLSRLSIRGARGFFTMNPDSPSHWFKTGYIDRSDSLNLKRFHFTIDDNPFLDPDYVADLKAEYVGLWRKRFIDGLWVLAEGAVYDMWDEDSHVIVRPPQPADYHVIGIDYGTGNPTCFVKIGCPRDRTRRPWCWAESEYWYDHKDHQKQKTDSQYADDLVRFIGKTRPAAIYVDPSALSFRVELQHRGIHVREADNAVIDGIRTQASLLGSGEYAVMSCCKNVISEYGGYVWDAKAQGRGEDKPVKQSDHGKDAERYALHSHFGGRRLDYNLMVKG